MAKRLAALKHWLETEVGFSEYSIEPASGDASFRRYFRVYHDQQVWIVMDAPPRQEDCHRFVGLARMLDKAGIHVPQVIRMDLDQGFLLLSDLGTRLYLNELNENTVERLYGDALGTLIILQTNRLDDFPVPDYDRALLERELELFPHWYLKQKRGIRLSESENKLWRQSVSLLVESALEQPRVWVHRDYHSRNLLLTQQQNPGVLDFQDAVIGPVTYDLVSLVRDCYIKWPEDQVEQWALGYHDLALQSGVLRNRDEEQFLRWMDWQGLQRHFKAIGIFARLYLRDGKEDYLKDVPRTLSYIFQITRKYRELTVLNDWLSDLGLEQNT